MFVFVFAQNKKKWIEWIEWMNWILNKIKAAKDGWKIKLHCNIIDKLLRKENAFDLIYWLKSIMNLKKKTTLFYNNYFQYQKMAAQNVKYVEL